MKNLLLLFLLLVSIATFAQDNIVKKNGDIINCKVTELAAGEIKYYYAENPKLIFGIDKALVEKVLFSTGEIIEIENNSFNNPEYYANQSKHAIKVNFLSPLMGSTEFVYEQSIKPGKSWEAALGIIGLGIDNQGIDPRGVYGKIAYKFMRNPDFYMQTMRYAHILKGAYFAPEIAMRYMSYDQYNYYYDNNYNYYDTSERDTKFSMVLTLKLGKQWIFEDVFLLDIYGGIGYGIGGTDEGLNYGFVVGPKDMPLAATGGIRVGWAFGK